MLLTPELAEVLRADINFNDANFLKLFVQEGVVTQEQAEQIFTNTGLERALETGFVTQDQNLVYAAVAITLYEGLYIVSDLEDHMRREPTAYEHVMGVGGATKSLLGAVLGAVPHERVSRSLDLGTGNGVIALRLAAISDEVVASDVSLRALEFARFNAALNAISNVVFVVSDLFEAFAEQKFDLIVSNPPFVISPEDQTSRQYRSSAASGDDFMHKLISEAPTHLNEGGVFVALGNWEREPEQLVGGAWWIIERGTQTPEEYVATWLRDGGVKPGAANYEELRAKWLADFALRQTSEITYGYILMRKQAVEFKRRELLQMRLENFGETWREIFDSVTYIQGRDVLSEVFERDESVYEIRTMIPGTEQIIALNMIRQRGIERNETVSSLVAAVVGACTGEMTLGEIARGLGVLWESPDIDNEITQILPELIWAGFLRPVEL